MFTGTSASLLLQPRELIESRNEAEAMSSSSAVFNWGRPVLQWNTQAEVVLFRKACRADGCTAEADWRLGCFRGAAAGDESGYAGL